MNGDTNPRDARGTPWLSDEIKRNMRAMRFNLVEFSGALGDLGTFLPLAAGMAFVAGMDLGVIFIFAGLANIFVGVVFGLPVSVQPMKVIAAVAIAETLDPTEIAAAGIILGAVMLILGLTRLVDFVERVIPLAVVRGIQLGVGLKLMSQALEFVVGTPWMGLDSIVVAGALGLMIIFTRRYRSFPGALLLFSAGLIVAFADTPGLIGRLSVGAPTLQTLVPSAGAWLNGFMYGALPQLPLTVLNSVLAVCVLTGDLFPSKRVPAPRMSASVGLVNILTCWFGAMPMCHGAGGLAAQYHFGARTGGSMVMLGVFNLVVGLLFGSAAVLILQSYPRSILGVMLLFAGLELALPAREEKQKRGFATVVLTAAGIVAIDTITGFIVGWAVHLVSSRRDQPRHN